MTQFARITFGFGFGLFSLLLFFQTKANLCLIVFIYNYNNFPTLASAVFICMQLVKRYMLICDTFCEDLPKYAETTIEI